jgi:hypothetical protein
LPPPSTLNKKHEFN